MILESAELYKWFSDEIKPVLRIGVIGLCILSCFACVVASLMARGRDAHLGGYRLDSSSLRFRSSFFESRRERRGRGLSDCCWRIRGGGRRAGGIRI